MKNVAAAKQYASAIYRASSLDGHDAEVFRELEQVERLLQESDEMTLFWNHPQIEPSIKLKAVQEVLNQTFLPQTERFLTLLLEHGRSDLVAGILTQFQSLQLEEQGILVVKAFTAKPLSEEEELNLIEKLHKEYGKNIQIEKHIQAGLLGGIKIQVEDTVYDSTIRRRLDKMREVLLPQFR